MRCLICLLVINVVTSNVCGIDKYKAKHAMAHGVKSKQRDTRWRHQIILQECNGSMSRSGMKSRTAVSRAQWPTPKRTMSK